MWNTTPINVGTASAKSEHAADLGKLIFINGKGYRVCKVGTSAITTAAKKVVVSALDASGQPTWVVALPGAQEYEGNYFLVVPAGQVGTGSTTTTLAAGDYFLAQVSGPTELLCNTSAGIAAGTSQALVALSTGKVKVSTQTVVAANLGVIGFPTLSAAAGASLGACLKGLI